MNEHIKDLEQTMAFECPRCIDPDPEEALPRRYEISEAIHLGLQCYHCKALLRLFEKG